MTNEIIRVRQRLPTDCGVACLAMVAGISYETGAEVFRSKRLGEQRNTKAPYSSNFQELRGVLQAAGVSNRMRRFNSWADLGHVSILKTRLFRNQKLHRDWHWVVAVRRGIPLPSGVPSIEILDPGNDGPCYEVMPMNVECVGFQFCKPFGNYLQINS